MPFCDLDPKVQMVTVLGRRDTESASANHGIGFVWAVPFMIWGFQASDWIAPGRTVGRLRHSVGPFINAPVLGYGSVDAARASVGRCF